VAVITPYHRESLELLLQCHRSVLAQDEPCLHVMVADGEPQQELAAWAVEHIQLPRSHGDIGSTPRLIGAYHAIGLGVEAVAFLDADNWYQPNHIADLLRCREQQQASFVSSSRLLCRLDGSAMGSCPITNPDRFIDTNCMMFGKEAFYLLDQWVLMPPYAHLIGDRIMLQHVVRSGVRRAHLDQPSVCYRCGKEGLYRLMAEPIPAGVQPRPNYDAAMRQWEKEGNPALP
jgi:glycosyltransferase involved in cell wall biosynthesis